VAADAAAEKAQREREQAAADIELKHSAAEWNRQRPAVAQTKALQDIIKFEIGNRLKDPRPFDPSNEDDSDLLSRARAYGVHISTGSFGDFKNPFSIEVFDPDDPAHIRKVRMAHDRATGTWTPVTGEGGKPLVTNRVQPVGDDGLTPAQRNADADRDTARENTQEYRRALLGLSSDRLHLQMSNGLGAQAKRAFDLKTKGLFEQRRQLETQINALRTRAAKREISPAELERRTSELQGKVDGLTGQIDGARSEALGSMSTAPGSLPVFNNAPAVPRAGRYTGQRMPKANLPAAAKALGMSEPEAKAYIEREGGVIY
jgi:hypothetical protein